MKYGYAYFMRTARSCRLRGYAVMRVARHAFTSPSSPLHLPFGSGFTSPSSPLHLPSPPLCSPSPIPPRGRRPLSAGCPSRKSNRAPQKIGAQLSTFSETQSQVFGIPYWPVPERSAR